MKLNVDTVGQERIQMTPDRMKDVIEETYNEYFCPNQFRRLKPRVMIN